MTHARKQIRDAAVTALTGLVTTATRVWADRPSGRTLQRSDLPALLLATGAETVADRTIHDPAELERELDLQIVALVSDTASLDDVLDQIALEVETALGGGTLLSDRVYVSLEGIGQPEFDGTGDTPVAQQVLRYRAVYRTAANAPGTIL